MRKQKNRNTYKWRPALSYENEIYTSPPYLEVTHTGGFTDHVCPCCYESIRGVARCDFCNLEIHIGCGNWLDLKGVMCSNCSAGVL